MTMMLKVSLVLAALLVGCQGDAQCNEQDIVCINAIKAAASNPNLFWFGTNYTTDCPARRDTFRCFNPKPPAQTIQARLYGSVALDRVLTVTYTSEKGEYTACGRSYTEPESATFTLNPVANENYKTWLVRNTPKVTWSASAQEQDAQFSLLLVDAGFGFAHAIYVNIKGGDISKGQAFLEYFGPGNPKPFPNPYVFILFKQTKKDITVDPKYKTQGSGFNLGEFIRVYQLNDPIAMSWVNAVGDPYALASLAKKGLNYCSLLVTEEARKQNRPWIPKDVTLDLYVNITFRSEAVKFNSCCGNYSYPQKTFELNPLIDDTLRTGDARTNGTARTYQFAIKSGKISAKAQTNFKNQLWTLLMVDPDIPSPNGNIRPRIHMLVVNIPNGVVENGEEVFSYTGPMPPDNKAHSYYYLVYQQRYRVSKDSYKDFTDANCPRCGLNVKGYVESNGLDLFGATWMTATTDEYVRYSHIVNRGRKPEDVCEGVDGYADPCPVGGAAKVSHWMLTSVMMVLLAVFFM